MSAILITELVVQPDKVEHALEYLRAMQADVHANEPYTGFYQMYRMQERPNEFCVVEVFENEAGKAAHLARHARAATARRIRLQRSSKRKRTRAP